MEPGTPAVPSLRIVLYFLGVHVNQVEGKFPVSVRNLEYAWTVDRLRKIDAPTALALRHVAVVTERVLADVIREAMRQEEPCAAMDLSEFVVSDGGGKLGGSFRISGDHEIADDSRIFTGVVGTIQVISLYDPVVRTLANRIERCAVGETTTQQTRDLDDCFSR